MITAASNDATILQSGFLSQEGDLGLGGDAFLKLLITEIQTQDPLEPLSAREFIAQLAQFSTVEQLQKTNLQLTILQRAEATSQALLLIGRTITTADGSVTGLVEGVVFCDGQPKLIVAGQQIDPGDVAQVW